jgi:hypothetical protein
MSEIGSWTDQQVKDEVATRYRKTIEGGEVPVVKRGTGMIGRVCGVCLNPISTTTGVCSDYCEHCKKYGVPTDEWFP